MPDLATTIPKPTNGGKTCTFHLKKGIKFGPPVNREITSKDVKYAIERLARPKNGAQYAFYFNVIRGFDAYGKGKTKSIAGIKTPNAKTIVFNLTEPDGRLRPARGHAGGGPDPARGREVLRGQARRVRSLRHRVRPVHDRGL